MLASEHEKLTLEIWKAKEKGKEGLIELMGEVIRLGNSKVIEVVADEFPNCGMKLELTW